MNEPHGFARLRSVVTQLTSGALTVSALALLVQWVGLEGASACSPPPTGFDFQLSYGSMSIPSDGVLLIETFCPDECAPANEGTFKVLDGTGAEIEGALVETPSPKVMAWIPTTPFAPGRFTLEGSHPDSEGQKSHSFEVRDELDVLPTQPMVSANTWAATRGPRVCCQEGIEDSCGALSCYQVVESVEPRIGVHFDFTDSAGVGPQAFVFRARAKGADWAEFTAWHQVGAEFEQEASEYCYEVQVQAIHAEGELYEFAGCLPASEVSPIDESSVEVEERSLFSYCTVPPEGYEARWCETFAENIAQGSCEGKPRVACEAAIAACPKLNADAGQNTNHDTGDAGTGDNHGNEDDDDTKDQVRKGSRTTGSSSCSAGAARVGGDGVAWGLALGGAAWALSRRRRRQSGFQAGAWRPRRHSVY